ncbi:inositol monophosphatase family protein [Limimaricola cinnabarinus]|uniref:inositol monophosphatase family protein n=1 Tax=Limimaricola cinnabarinus TaxID=1125964 RepID=UPI002FE0DA11
MTGTLSDDLMRDLAATAHALADAARPETLRHFRQTIATDDKTGAGAGFDPVTEADRASERAMRDVLAARRPDDAILGEEYGATPGSSGLTWVLDPIDGTRAYISGMPTWGVLVSVCDATGPLFGLIDQPYIAERFEGGFGTARLMGPRGEMPLRGRTARPLAEATVMTTFPEVGTPAERAGFEAVSQAARLTRYGMDCYAYALVAMGQVDLVVEAGLNSYDVCGPIAVIEAAGGIVTDWEGRPAHEGGRVLAAANAQIHAEALALLKGR